MATDFAIRHASRIIRQGGVIAYPTDTIYGLGCDPFDADAVERINRIKQRPGGKFFILLAADIVQLQGLLATTAAEEKQLQTGDRPTSWIVPASDSAPPWLTAADNSLSVRLCRQPDVVRLCARLGHAIISTSANLSGHRSATGALDLHRYFHASVDKILLADRPLPGKASRIIHLREQRVIRE